MRKQEIKVVGNTISESLVLLNPRTTPQQWIVVRIDESSGAMEAHPRGRVAAHLTMRSPHRSPPADFLHEPLQQLIHSTARDCILAKGMYNLGHRNGNDFLIF